MPTISVNQTLSGTITSTDPATNQENWTVTLAGGTTYTIRAMGVGTGSYTLGDPYIEGVFRGGSTFVGFNNDGLIAGPNGRDAMFTFTTPTGAATSYTITVTGDRFTIGTYGISVSNSSGGTDNVGTGTATTGTVAVGGSVSGSIDNAADSDWYRVSLVSGTSYSIRMRGLSGGGGTLPDPSITGLFDASGNYIGNTYVDDIDTRDASLKFVAPYTGNYYIAADGWSNYTGTFTLDVAVAGNDVTSHTGTSASVPVGGSTTVLIEQPYDHDWYAVSLTAGATYQFSLSGTGYNNTPGLHGIINSAGTYVVSYASPVLGPSSAAASTIFTPTASGTYFIDTYSLYEGTYTLTAAQIAFDVPANVSSTTTIAVDSSVTGDIGGATDIDWYKVELVAGTTYVIKMQGKQSNNGTLEDPMISGIYNASGALVLNTFSDDNDGNEASLMFRPATTGTYYIAADGYAGFTGTFNLSVTASPGDVGQTVATAVDTSTNLPTLVTIDDTADVDWYRVSLDAGNTYVVRLQGAHTKRGTLYDPVLLGIYDSTGTLIPDTFIDDVGELRNAKLAFTPTTSGIYYVAADGYDRFTGTMKLAVTIDNIGTTNGTAGSLIVGTGEEGTIDSAGDVDRYGVSLEASTVYYFRMLGFFSRNGDLPDPHISGVYNAGGTLQGTTAITDPLAVGTDAWVKLTTSTAGTYYVVAEGNGGDGSFLMTVEKEVAANATTTANIATIPGSYLGFIEETNDVDWVSVTLNTNISYLIKMRGFDSNNGTLVDPYINGIRHSSNTTLVIAGTTVNDVDTRDSLVRLIPGSAGLHYIAAQSNGGVTTGSFLLSVETEPGNTAPSSWALTNPGTVEGTIDDTTDKDWYSVSLNTNTSYVIKMLGVDSGLGTLDNPYINGIFYASDLVTPVAGTSGAAVDSAVLRDSVARINPTSAGTYYINAQSGTTTMGTYILSIATEPGNTLQSSFSMALGETVLGTIDDNADIDYYKIWLDNTSSYLFNMIVSDGTSTLSDALIASIRNSANGAVAGAAFNSTGVDAFARWAPATSDYYYVEAKGINTNNGTFQLLAETEPGSSTTAAASISAGETVTGKIDDNADTDYYRITIDPSIGYVFKMIVTGGAGTLSDSNIVLHDSNNAVVNATASLSSTADYTFRWIPTGAGDFYIEAKGNAANNGTYTLTALQEGGSSTSTASTISLGQSIDAAIDDNADTDYYRINLTSGTSYVFKMLVTGGIGTLNDTNIELRDSNNAIVNATASLSSTADYSFRWLATGTNNYYVVAKGTTLNNGTYRITADMDPGSATTNAGSIAVGGTVDSAIDDNADIDYYRINLSTTSSYLFKMIVTGGVGTLNDTVLQLRDGNNVQKTPDSTATGTADSILRWTPDANADFFLEAKGVTTNNGTYRLIAEAEAGHTRTSAGSIAVGETVDSAITDNADIDFYRINLSKTQSYLFKMIVTGGVGTLTDTVIQLHNASGTEAAAGSVSGTADYTYRWSPAADGTFYIEAKGTGANNGTYRLVVDTELGNTVDSAGTITVGGTVDSTIDDITDIDYFKVNLSNTQSYVFRMTVSGGVGTLSDATIASIRNGSDTILPGMGTYSPGVDFAARWSPVTTGDYYIEAKGTGANSGTYRLAVDIETGGTTTSAGSMTDGVPVNDTIDDPTDTDYYRISLNSGISYVFKMIVSGGVGTLGDTEILFHDSTNGIVGAAGTNSATTDYSFRWAGSAGDYYIEAKGTGANAGTYRLVVETETGTYSTNYGTLAVGNSVDDTINDNADTDYYRISLNGGTSYVFKMIVSGGVGTLADTEIVFYDGTNAIVGATGALSTTTDYSFRWTGSAGDYYIEAKGTGANNGTYRLVAATETGTNTSNYGTIAVGGLVNDTIDDVTDTDYYRITLDNTKSYLFKMAVSGGGYTLSDTAITVRDVLSNNSIAATGSNASTTDFSYRWEPGTAGDYYIEAAGTGANAGTYRLTAEVEAGSNIAKALAIDLTGLPVPSVTLNVAIDDTTDVDYYKVSLENTKSYQFRMISSGGVGTLTDSTIAVKNGLDAGLGVTFSNFTGSDSIVRWEPGTGGDYYIDARGVGAIAGTYRLIVEQEGGPTRAKAMDAPIGTSINALIDTASEVDFYKVTLASSRSYVFKMISSGGVGTLTDSSIALQDSGGGAVTASGTNSTGADYYLRYMTSAAGGGVYYLNTTGPSSAVGTYQLTAELEPGNSNDSALGTAVGTSVVGRLEDGSDTDWWAVELTEGYEYTISMQGADSGNGTLSDAYINGIRNISGTMLGSTQQDSGTPAGSMGDAVLTGFSPTVTGTYFIQCDNGINSTSASGTYLLTVTQTNPPPPSGMAPQGMQAEESVTLMGVTTFNPESQAMTLL